MKNISVLEIDELKQLELVQVLGGRAIMSNSVNIGVTCTGNNGCGTKENCVNDGCANTANCVAGCDCSPK